MCDDDDDDDGSERRKRARRDEKAAFVRFIEEVPIFVLSTIFALTDDPLIGARLSIASRAVAHRLTRLPDYDANVLWRPLYQACYPRLTKLLPGLEHDVKDGRITRARGMMRHITWLTSRLRRMTFCVASGDRCKEFRPFANACTGQELRARADGFARRVISNTRLFCEPRDGASLSFRIGYAVRTQENEPSSFVLHLIDKPAFDNLFSGFMLMRVRIQRKQPPRGHPYLYRREIEVCLRGSLIWDGITDAFAAQLEHFVR